MFSGVFVHYLHAPMHVGENIHRNQPIDKEAKTAALQAYEPSLFYPLICTLFIERASYFRRLLYTFYYYWVDKYDLLYRSFLLCRVSSSRGSTIPLSWPEIRNAGRK